MRSNQETIASNQEEIAENVKKGFQEIKDKLVSVAQKSSWSNFSPQAEFGKKAEQYYQNSRQLILDVNLGSKGNFCRHILNNPLH